MVYELLTDHQILRKNVNELNNQIKRTNAAINLLKLKTVFTEHTLILAIFVNQFVWET